MFITDHNEKQRDQLTGKMTHDDFQKNARSLGFLYNVTNSKYFCGVALVNTYIVHADGSCIHNETNLSKINVHFKVYGPKKDRPSYGIFEKIHIPNTVVDIMFIVVSTCYTNSRLLT